MDDDQFKQLLAKLDELKAVLEQTTHALRVAIPQQNYADVGRCRFCGQHHGVNMHCPALSGTVFQGWR